MKTRSIVVVLSLVGGLTPHEQPQAFATLLIEAQAAKARTTSPQGQRPGDLLLECAAGNNDACTRLRALAQPSLDRIENLPRDPKWNDYGYERSQAEEVLKVDSEAGIIGIAFLPFAFPVGPGVRENAINRLSDRRLLRMILERNGMQASAAPRFVELAAEGCTPNVDRLRSFLETRFRVESEVVVPWWERAPPPATPISLSAVDPKVTSAVQQRAMNQAFAVMKAAGISAQARGAGPNVLRIDAIVWAQSAQYQFNRNSGAITIFAGASAHLAVSARDAEGCVYATQVTHEIPPPKGAQLGQAPPLEAAVAGAVTDGVNQMLNYR